MTRADPSTPRSRDEPMAFTDREVMRGAWGAWLSFMVLLLLTVTLVTVVDELMYVPQPGVGRVSSLQILWVALGYVGAIGGAVSLLVMIVLLPLARRAAHRMRRVERAWLHALLCAAVGAAIGVIVAGVIVVVVLVTRGTVPSILPQALTLGAVAALLCGIAMPMGWWLMYRRALREDAALPVGGEITAGGG